MLNERERRRRRPTRPLGTTREKRQPECPTRLLSPGESRRPRAVIYALGGRPERASDQARRRRPLPREAAARRSIGLIRAHRSVHGSSRRRSRPAMDTGGAGHAGGEEGCGRRRGRLGVGVRIRVVAARRHARCRAALRRRAWGRRRGRVGRRSASWRSARSARQPGRSVCWMRSAISGSRSASATLSAARTRDMSTSRIGWWTARCMTASTMNATVCSVAFYAGRTGASGTTLAALDEIASVALRPSIISPRG